jgi:hypothetical protein
MAVTALGARPEQHDKVSEVALMTNLITGRIRQRVSKMGAAELVLHSRSVRCLSGDVAL